jgi:Ca2+-binding RTX toxin-like protein
MIRVDLFSSRSWFVVLVLGALVIPSTIVSVSAAYLTGTGGNNTLYGTSRADTIYGYGGDDKIYGYAGDDKLYGNSGNDMISAGPGNDKAYGGSGSDKLYGHRGDDLLDGGGGNDYIQDSYGYNTIYGRDGADNINFLFVDDSGGPTSSVGGTIYGGSGPDTIRCEGYSCAIYGGGGNDKIYLTPRDIENVAFGGTENDYIEGIGHGILYGEDGADTLVGGSEQIGGPGADRFICKQYVEIHDYNPGEGDVIENRSLCWEISSP